jgi:hypothetical protein
VFWVHVGSFAAYNGVIGYLLAHRETPGLGSVAVFAVAMALHFLVTDYGFQYHYDEAYGGLGRWILAATVVAGAVLGLLTAVGETFLGNLFAFLSGGIVLNTIKEELPAERESRFWAFALGAGTYSALLVVS